MMEEKDGKIRARFNMYEPAVFGLRLQGELGEDWADYFGAQSMSLEIDPDGHTVTILTTEPVDQAGLIGIINHVNMLGLPLVSVECLSAD
jgi:hypothetical protein